MEAFTYYIFYVISAYLMADFISGLFHWMEDRYFTVDMPIIGEYIAAPNEKHHIEPLAFLKGNYWTRNWTTILPALFVALICLSFYQFWLALVFIISSQSNEIHCWSHSKGSVNIFIKTLQETGLLQSPSHHGQHHYSPFAKRFCVLTNILNPILDVTRFWRGLEYILLQLNIKVKDI